MQEVKFPGLIEIEPSVHAVTGCEARVSRVRGAHLLCGGDRDLGEAGDGEAGGRLAEVHARQLLALLRER